MKKQRKINSSRKPISNAEIQETKSSFENIKAKFDGFSGIIGNSTNWIIGIVSAVAISSAVWLITSNNNEMITENTEVISQDSIEIKREINPPFADKLVFEEFEFDSSKDQEITSESGSKIFIPANCFVDENNQPIIGNVKLKFNDYHNPLEIFYSGIPMQYDSSGIDYTFMSGGMFQISAEKDNKDIYIAEGKYIDIELVSNSSERFNFYEYDTISNSWNYLNTENEADITQISNELEKANNGIENLQRKIEMHNDLSENKTASNNVNNQVSIKTELSERYIVNVDKGRLAGAYELYPNQNFKEEYYKVAWDNISVKEDLESEDYILEMKKGSTKFSFLAYPASNNDYGKLSEKSKVEEAEKQKRIAMQKENRDKIKFLRTQQRRFEKLRNYGYNSTRNLRVYRLSTYNIDKPLPEPMMAKSSNVILKDDNGNPLDYNNIQVCQLEQNVLWNYNKNQNWKYSGQFTNILWVISSNNTVSLLLPEEFADLENKSEVNLRTYDLEFGLMAIDELISEYAMN
jgi:hypothetical protein